MRAVRRVIQTGASNPAMDDPSILAGRNMGLLMDPAWKKEAPIADFEYRQPILDRRPGLLREFELRPRPVRYRRWRRKRPPPRPGETTQGQVWRLLLLGVQIVRSPTLAPVTIRLQIQDLSKEAGDERSDRKKHPVAQLQDSQHARQRRGARRPAPFRQTVQTSTNAAAPERTRPSLART